MTVTQSDDRVNINKVRKIDTVIRNVVLLCLNSIRRLIVSVGLIVVRRSLSKLYPPRLLGERTPLATRAATSGCRPRLLSQKIATFFHHPYSLTVPSSNFVLVLRDEKGNGRDALRYLNDAELLRDEGIE